MEESEEEENIKEEVYIKDNNLFKFNHIVNISKSIVKIKVQQKKFGTGFLIKFNKINKPLYCLMTNEHIVSNDMIKNEEKIEIFYENEKSHLSIKLNKKERIIQTFKEMKIDVTIIEILEKDKINKEYFLSSISYYINEYKYFIGEDIEIQQFPLGKDLFLSKGKVLE